MSSAAQYLYEFGPYRLDVDERLLTRDGEAVEMTAKVFDLLVILVENPGKLLEKSFLLDQLWPNSFVEEVNLSVNISALRKALGEQPSSPQFIETVPKRGYRFIGNVTTQVVSDDKPSLALSGERTVLQSPEMSASSVATSTKEDSTTSARAPNRSGRTDGHPYSLMGAALIVTAALGFAVYLVLKQPNKKTPPVARTHVIAVLPFKTLTNVEADQALGLGMADALINRLGNLQRVIVRPTSTILKYSTADLDPQAAGRDLGVEAVLDGRLQRDDKKIRVTAQLIKVEDGSSLWTGTFDDFFTNLFALQDSISERMAEALSLQLTRDEQQLMARRNTEDTEAYQLYVQGRYFHFKYEFDKAERFLQQAIDRDPEFALAYAALAVNYEALATRNPSPQQLRDKAIEAASKALSLDPNLDEAYNAMGWVKFLGDWDWSAAETSLRHAIELKPNNADAHINLAALLICLGRLDEGLRESEQALQLDPVSDDINFNYAYNLVFARQNDRAMAQGKRMMELNPHHPSLGTTMASIYLANSMFEQARNVVEQNYGDEAARKNPYLALAYKGLGQQAKAQDVLNTMLQEPTRAGRRYSIALVYAALGDKERTLEWLEKSYQSHDNQMIHLKVEPGWDILRSDPRFISLLQRMHL
jgi:DNA-binding winged helix-turn-helix (wHTH) protein/TolB-like protein/Flp pilus assembly protein TadD